MKAEFATAVFGPLRRFVGVLMQQGRVLLDSDAAEPSPLDKKRWPSPDPKGQKSGKDTHIGPRD